MERRARSGLTAEEGRSFAFTVGAAFLLLTGLFYWRDLETAGAVAGGLGTLLLFAGVVVPGRLGPVYRAWMGLGKALSTVVNPIVMAVVYFGILTPVGFVRRVLGGNPLVHDPEGESYWADRSRGPTGSPMNRQF